jgi:hypothetical protein
MNTWAWPGSAISIATIIMSLSLVLGFAILPETKNVRYFKTRKKLF